MDRRKFVKTTAAASVVVTLSPNGLLRPYPVHGMQYFGVHNFIENNPEAVFIMRTDVDIKTNSAAIKSAGEAFAGTVLSAKTEDQLNAVPVSHKIAIKPNLTLRFNWDKRYTVEGTMGIVTDAYFVEGVIDVMKGFGIAGEQFHIIETNYNGEDLTKGGYLDMVERTGAHLKDLYNGIGKIDESNIVWKDVNDGGYFSKIPYIFPVNAPDSWLINIAKFKAHSMGITACAKNLQGTIVREYQQHCKSHTSGDLNGMSEEHRVTDALLKIEQSYQGHKDSIPRWDHPDRGLNMETWATRCLDNNSAINAGLHVIEGVYGRDGHFVAGPSLGDDSKDGIATDYMTNIIIFGKNPFNVDIIAHWLAGHEPGNFGLFHLAIERGLSTKLNPMDIPVYEWKPDATATMTPLTDFKRTPLKTKYLQRDYDGQNETYWHICNESYDYSATPVGLQSDVGKTCAYALSQNYPNPFNPRTTIEYQVSTPGRVRIEIYDMRGSIVDIPTDEYHVRGRHMLVWDAAEYPSGSYFYRLSARNGYQITKRMNLLK